MTEEEKKERTLRNRKFMCMSRPEKDAIPPDQLKGVPQPALEIAPDPAHKIISLSKDFRQLNMEQDFVRILFNRESKRVFTEGEISLDTLSFLLWAMQGVKSIRGDHFALMRTVPSGGARHPYETYLVVRKIEGLPSGLYHYLSIEHALELIREEDPADEEFKAQLDDALFHQGWPMKANVIFFFDCIPYRAEWRYGPDSHRAMLIDAGHITENLYLACSALGLGTCAQAALDTEKCDRLFELDTEENYIIYAAPVGTVSPTDEKLEREYFSTIHDEAAAKHE